MKVAYDFFMGTGSATKAFRQHPDWKVIGIEKDPEKVEDYGAEIQADILEITPDELPEQDPEFIWASPPCTKFSVARMWDHWSEDQEEQNMPDNQEIPRHTQFVYHTLYLINKLDPDYWFLENPRGMLRKVMPFERQATITYCQYGFEWQKPTDLWGVHPASFEYRDCSQGGDCHQYSGRGYSSGKMKNHIREPEERARVPEQLSQEVLEAVENPGKKTKQVKLAE